MEYPCKECILFTNCSELCGKVVLERDEIISFMFEHKRCIDCGGTKCIEYNSIQKDRRYILCLCGSLYTISLEGKYEFDRREKWNGPTPSIKNGAVFNGEPTTFVNFLVEHIRMFMGEK
jgi:hypothetical protein